MDTHDQDGRPLYETARDPVLGDWMVFLGGKLAMHGFRTRRDAQDWIDAQPTPEPDPEVVAERLASSASNDDY